MCEVICVNLGVWGTRWDPNKKVGGGGSYIGWFTLH